MEWHDLAFMQSGHNMAAAGLALAASAILSFIDNFVAAVGQEAGLWQFHVFRTLFAIPMFLAIALATRTRLRPLGLKKLAGRSLVVSAGLLIYFAALGTLPVAQAGAGLFSAPLWVAILSVVIFGHRLGFTRWIAVFVGFAGALMLLQPDPNTLTVMSLLPLAAGLFYGLGMMLTGIWCVQESPLSLALGVFLTIGIASLVMLSVTTALPGDTFLTAPWVTPTPRFLWLTLVQAIGAVIAVTLIAQAYRTGAPAVVAVFEYSFLIFASLWSILLWGIPTNALAIAGIAVILSAGSLMTFAGRKRPDALTPATPDKT
ncbi:MAG: DMT family transporter [Roseibium sp.]|uniref:DMT family transporter n=1 Tax=Roseibium sp. TaxID=1936156 RepID=UPI002606D45D|nr:DMT family transporter [Roseibium sp.]MCV0429730.1 DMT family transporter [Roseibium sp.]